MTVVLSMTIFNNTIMAIAHFDLVRHDRWSPARCACLQIYVDLQCSRTYTSVTNDVHRLLSVVVIDTVWGVTAARIIITPVQARIQGGSGGSHEPPFL